MIHRFWIGPAEPPFEPFIGNAVRSLHRGVEVRDWTMETLPPSIVRYVEANAHKVVDRDRARHTGNMVRWLLLQEFGGLWLDHDLLPLRRLDHLRCACSYMGSQRSSGVLALAPGSPLAAAVLHEVERYRGPKTTSVRLSGDEALRRHSLGLPMTHIYLPHDALGQWQGIADPDVVHLWYTGARRLPCQLGYEEKLAEAQALR